jgi:transcription antitermination factor NusG
MLATMHDATDRTPAAYGSAVRWHVLEVERRHERSVKAQLQGSGVDVCFPQEKVWTTRGVSRKKVSFMKAFFPGYAFALLDYDFDHRRRQQVVNTLGVRFMRVCDGIGFIRNSEIDRIKREVELRHAEVDAPLDVFKVGDDVRVKDGPFGGYSGAISRLETAERVQLLLRAVSVLRVTVQTSSIELV